LPASRNLAGPHPDRLHVVPGHVVETAAPGLRRLAILDPTGIDGCGVRVSPHFHEGFRVASHDNLWTDCLSCRTGLRWIDAPRACGAVVGRARGLVYAATLAWPLWHFVRVALDLHVPRASNVPVRSRGRRPQS